MDLDRVVQLVSSGDASRRSLIEIPTGHQLHSSVEALETFQLIASEVGRIALGRALKPVPPDPVEVESARRRERARRPSLEFDPKSFWRNYLLGRTGEVGFQLLTATSAYRLLMARQVELLALTGREVVLDLGSGTGELAQLISASQCANGVTLLELDLVREALVRSRARLGERARGATVERVVSDFELEDWFLPIRPGSVDAALLSLVIGYVRDPLALLRATAACLKPKGRLVVSSMKRDADISKIYVEGSAELQPGVIAELFGPNVAERFDSLQRDFLNSAARLLDLEHEGRFRFFDARELSGLLASAGFEVVRSLEALGDPAQAVVVAACRV
jgi:SAM-dependent methyltransferase